MQAAGAALVQGVMDGMQQGQQAQQSFQQGAGGTPGSQVGTGGQPQEEGGFVNGLSSLIKNKTSEAVGGALTPEIGGAMNGVPQLDMSQMTQANMPMQSSLSPDILQMLRQRGMVL